MFISFEGIDGSGKSTQAKLLAAALRAEGRDVVETREPGGTGLGERIRDLLLGGGPISPWAEAVLFAAARAQLVEEVIAPSLERGADVVCDRYLDSSLAYQGIARGLGLDAVFDLNRGPTGGLLPDRTFLLLFPPEEALLRSRGRPDRIEGEGLELLERVDRAYRRLAELHRGASSRSTRPAPPTRLPGMSSGTFERLPEQAEAKRLLRAALADDPAHAYLFVGPPGVGKRAAALAFAAGLLGEEERVERRIHPDLYVLEPLGDQIRIDAIRELRHDLHMRPFEAARRVYLIFGADLMNEDAADALLKDLEEPPPYATIVLVAAEPQRLPETIRSRCQLVPFRRLSRRALEEHVVALRPDLPAEALAAVSRVAGGRLDRADRLLDPQAEDLRSHLIGLARSVYLADRFDPAHAARELVEAARAAGAAAADADPGAGEGTAREREQRARRIARGAEREEIVGGLELLAGWYRDVLAASAGAGETVLNADHAADLAADGALVGIGEAVAAAEAVAETRRSFELNVSPPLALEALFVRLRKELGRLVRPAAAGSRL